MGGEGVWGMDGCVYRGGCAWGVCMGIGVRRMLYHDL